MDACTVCYACTIFYDPSLLDITTYLYTLYYVAYPLCVMDMSYESCILHITW